jgi:hypothetical protein
MAEEVRVRVRVKVRPQGRRSKVERSKVEPGAEGRREGAREWRTGRSEGVEEGRGESGKERRSEGVEEGSREKEGGEELRVAGPKGQVEPAVEGMREKEEKAGRREAVG